MVEHDLAKVRTGVRFSSSARIQKIVHTEYTIRVINKLYIEGEKDNMIKAIENIIKCAIISITSILCIEIITSQLGKDTKNNDGKK